MWKVAVHPAGVGIAKFPWDLFFFEKKSHGLHICAIWQQPCNTSHSLKFIKWGVGGWPGSLICTRTEVKKRKRKGKGNVYLGNSETVLYQERETIDCVFLRLCNMMYAHWNVERPASFYAVTQCETYVIHPFTEFQGGRAPHTFLKDRQYRFLDPSGCVSKSPSKM